MNSSALFYSFVGRLSSTVYIQLYWNYRPREYIETCDSGLSQMRTQYDIPLYKATTFGPIIIPTIHVELQRGKPSYL